MRIIGGAFRGKKITAPPAILVRPTTDFAKTGLFNILSNRYTFASIKVLDLYAGIGSITYEFISRGCRNIISVDRNSTCVEFIRRTAEQLKVAAVYKIIHADALTYLEKNDEAYDIIFADPPFDVDIAENIYSTVKQKNKILPGGILILEHSSERDYSSLRGFKEARKYGQITFSFFMHDVDLLNSQKD